MAENNGSSSCFQLKNEFVPSVIICLLGLISNLLLLNAYIKDPLKCFGNSGSYLVINLTVSDFLACLIAPFNFSVNVKSWMLVFSWFVAYFYSVSTATLVSISIDRYLMVAYPLKHRVLLKRKVIAVWVAVLWIISTGTPTKRLIFGTEVYDEIVFALFGIIVIIFSTVMYSLTYFKLRKQSKNLALQNSSVPDSRAQAKRILKEKKFLRTIILIACIAFLCIVPSAVFYSLSVLNNNLASRIVTCILSATFFTNFAVNPLVYIIRLPNYRKSFYLLYFTRQISHA